MKRGGGSRLFTKASLAFVTILLVAATFFVMMTSVTPGGENPNNNMQTSEDGMLPGLDLSSHTPQQLSDLRRKLSHLLEQIPAAQKELDKQYKDFDKKTRGLLDTIDAAHAAQIEERRKKANGNSDKGGCASDLKGYGDDGDKYVYDRNLEKIDRSKVFGTLYSNPGNHPPFIMALQVLINSFRHSGSKAPFIVFHLDPWEILETGLTPANISALRELDVDFRRVEDVGPEFKEEALKQIGTYAWRIAFNKVAMWKMTEFSKIVLMDYDGVVLKNMDFLLDFPDMAGSNDQAEDYGKSFRNLNTGVLIAKPNPSIYQRYVDWVNQVQPDSGVLRLSEQALLMDLYGQHREINLLPNTFGLSPAGAVANIANREQFTWDEVYYIHYYCANIGVPKPWDLARHTDGLDPSYPDKNDVWAVSFSVWFQARERWWNQDYSTTPYEFTPYKGKID